MKLQNQVCSLELSKKLKELGVKQESLWYWIRDDDNVGIGFSEYGWDKYMLCYPHIFHCDDKIYMLYNGNEFGRYGFGLAILE